MYLFVLTDIKNLLVAQAGERLGGRGVGIEPSTFQPVVQRFTNWSTLAAIISILYGQTFRTVTTQLIRGQRRTCIYDIKLVKIDVETIGPRSKSTKYYVH
jgi:hypothetical protein